jgi:hypothetical protein
VEALISGARCGNGIPVPRIVRDSQGISTLGVGLASVDIANNDYLVPRYLPDQ